ncbi:MAG: HU family DNA-binding protein [Candidatus Dojkabacteria bacterium]|nr:HU family DNA-binding protein [Candidatus Dojkabacteria bacterium]
MNKADLVKAVASKTGLSQKDVYAVVDATMEVIMKAVADGENVALTNFGTFASLQRKASTKRNPKTGAEVKVPAKRVPKFRPGKQFRDSVAK